MFGSVKRSAGRAARNAKGGGGLSFIGPDVVVSGDVAAKSQIHIDGRVDGNVACETLIQGGGGVIAGHIVADAAHLAGLVDGTVKARLVTLEATARVTGDVAYETLSIAAGAAIEGRLTRKEAAASVEIPPQPAEPSPPAKPKIAKAPKNPPKAEEPGLLAAALPAAPAPAAAG